MCIAYYFLDSGLWRALPQYNIEVSSPSTRPTVFSLKTIYLQTSTLSKPSLSNSKNVPRPDRPPLSFPHHSHRTVQRRLRTLFGIGDRICTLTLVDSMSFHSVINSLHGGRGNVGYPAIQWQEAFGRPWTLQILTDAICFRSGASSSH